MAAEHEYKKRRGVIAREMAKLEQECYADGVMAAVTKLEGLVLSCSDDEIGFELARFVKSNREEFAND